MFTFLIKGQTVLYVGDPCTDLPTFSLTLKNLTGFYVNWGHSIGGGLTLYLKPFSQCICWGENQPPWFTMELGDLIGELVPNLVGYAI